MKKIVLSVLVLPFLFLSCASKLVPPQDQHRTIKVAAPVNAVYRAVKPSLMKHGYIIVDRDITTGVTKARRRNDNKMVVISVRRNPEDNALVKIRLIAEKNGRPLQVPEKTMNELDQILQDIQHIASEL